MSKFGTKQELGIWLANWTEFLNEKNQQKTCKPALRLGTQLDQFI